MSLGDGISMNFLIFPKGASGDPGKDQIKSALCYSFVSVLVTVVRYSRWFPELLKLLCWVVGRCMGEEKCLDSESLRDSGVAWII